MLKYDKERLIYLIARDAYQAGEVVLSSGKVSDHYYDLRRVTLSSEGAAMIAAGVLHAMLHARSAIVAVGGPTIGADPIVGAVLATARGSYLAWELAGFLVRPEAKGHGMGRRVEGPPFEPGAAVAVVEDVATTGGSIVRAIDAVEAEGAKVVLAVAVFDRREGAAERIAARGVKFQSLVTARDLAVRTPEI
jgi:orotate phosphoribosyltransferase